MFSDRQRFEHDESLVGMGGGIELHWRRNLSLRGDVGWALTDSDQLGVDQGDVQGYFSITTLY